APAINSGGSVPLTEPWWNEDFWYRMAITVDNSTNSDSLINYQVQTEVTYDSDMDADFNDIRFIADDHTTVIPYWIESYTVSTSATVWFRVPLVPANSTATVYIYYSNASATSQSSFDNTMQKLTWDEAGGVFGGIWSMDAGSGTTVADSSGNGNSGVLSGTGYTWEASDGGNWAGTGQTFATGSALGFDATDGYISINHAALNGADEVTTEFWINTTDNQDGILSSANSGQHNEYLIYSQESFNPYIKGSNFSAGSAFNDDVWHHIAMVRHSDGSVDCYIDATLVGTGSLPSGALTVDSGGLIIAQDQDNVGGGFEAYQAFGGIIDELAIYSRSLSADELTCHYERRKFTAIEPTTSYGAEVARDAAIEETTWGQIKAM
ncbi:DUF2341 domain-containing protein, partial [bacterium]|nr:DUF2341 domain-containing protein [bacterium]